jgi:hypothetical protein
LLANIESNTIVQSATELISLRIKITDFGTAGGFVFVSVAIAGKSYRLSQTGVE